MQLLAEAEGVFTETAGGVTVGCARKLYRQGRIKPEETTVLCITGNGLEDYRCAHRPVRSRRRRFAPKLAEFEAYLEKTLGCRGNGRSVK